MEVLVFAGGDPLDARFASALPVDAFIVAQGTQRTDGSLDAESVQSGFGKGFGRFGDGRHGPGDPNKVAPSAAPSGTPG